MTRALDIAIAVLLITLIFLAVTHGRAFDFYTGHGSPCDGLAMADCGQR